MKKAIVLFSVLLFLWITGCAYCYVCNIRNDCRIVPVASVQKPDSVSTAKIAAVVPQIMNLYFDFNGKMVQLSGEDKKHIDEFRKYVSENPGSVIAVSGHSDRVGSQQAKLKISMDRARFVQEQLIAAGIDATLINISGKSDSEPVAAENTPEGNAKNRRAQIQIK